jgi:hypothetical protein
MLINVFGIFWLKNVHLASSLTIHLLILTLLFNDYIIIQFQTSFYENAFEKNSKNINNNEKESC